MFSSSCKRHSFPCLISNSMLKFALSLDAGKTFSLLCYSFLMCSGWQLSPFWLEKLRTLGSYQRLANEHHKDTRPSVRWVTSSSPLNLPTPLQSYAMQLEVSEELRLRRVIDTFEDQMETGKQQRLIKRQVFSSPARPLYSKVVSRTFYKGE